MRYVNISGRRKFEDDSAPSSVQSVESCEVFGSPYSDLSDCEFHEEKRINRGIYSSPMPSVSSSSYSFRSMMEPDRFEATPLLTAPTQCYKTIDSSDSLGPADLSNDTVLSTYRKQFDKPLKSEKKKQSSLITIFSVWNTIMGSSLLTMAWGVERAGLPVALVLVAVMSALCLFTAYILLTVNRHHGSENCEVPALCGTLLGPVPKAIAHVFSVLVLLGANIVYWILITNFLYFTVNYFTDLYSSNGTTYNSTVICPSIKIDLNGSLMIPVPNVDTAYWGLHSTVPIYVALIIFPLLNFKNVTFFTKFNSLGTLSVLYLLVFVIVKGVTWGINFNTAPGDSPPAKNAAVLSGMLALSFYIHNIIISIMSNNARPDKNARDLTIAFILVTLTYVLVGAVFYVCFPLAKSCIEDNLLNNFEMHDVMTAVARVLLLFQVVTVYPLVAFMLRTEAILLLPFKESRLLTIAINICIIILCILVACFCPNIGTIIRYTGAVSGLVHVFALPSMLQIRSLQLRGKLTMSKLVFYAAIMIFGAINLMMQFFINE